MNGLVIVQPSEREASDQFYSLDQRASKLSRGAVSVELRKMDKLARKKPRKSMGHLKYWKDWHYIMLECPSFRPGEFEKIDTVVVITSRWRLRRRIRTLRKVFDRLREDSKFDVDLNTVNEFCAVLARGGK